MSPPPTQCRITDVTPRIGSQVEADIDTLLSGREAENIRATLEQRGVIFFRGLHISDDQQVAIAETLGTVVANEGEGGIYKISLDDTVNQRAKYLKGVVVLALRRVVAALPESGDVAACGEAFRDGRRYRVLQYLRRLR